MNIEQEKEKCIGCGEETPYMIDEPVDMRLNYVEGAGQLCEKCINKIYGNE